MAAARGRRGGSVSEGNCVKCKKMIGGCWFQCDACDSWTHAESMSADEYQTLKKNQTSDTIVTIVSRRQLSMPHCNAQNKRTICRPLKRKSKKHFNSSRKSE